MIKSSITFNIETIIAMTKLPVEPLMTDSPPGLQSKPCEDSATIDQVQHLESATVTNETDSLDCKLARLFIAMAMASLRDKQDPS